LDSQPLDIEIDPEPDRIEIRPRVALDLRPGSCLELIR